MHVWMYVHLRFFHEHGNEDIYPQPVSAANLSNYNYPGLRLYELSQTTLHSR